MIARATDSPSRVQVQPVQNMASAVMSAKNTADCRSGRRGRGAGSWFLARPA